MHDRADRTRQAAPDAALDYFAVRVSMLSGKTFVVRRCIEKHKIDYFVVRVSMLSGKTFVVRRCIDKHKISDVEVVWPK